VEGLVVDDLKHRMAVVLMVKGGVVHNVEVVDGSVAKGQNVGMIGKYVFISILVSKMNCIISVVSAKKWNMS
jgi:hypothetical protein